MENKPVIIVGVLDKIGSSNVWMATSFMKRGIQVIPVNYRTLIASHGHDFFKNYLLTLVKNYSPSLVIFCKCNGVDPKIVEECSKFAKTFLFFMDLYVIAEKSPEIIEHAKNSHFSSCTSEITVDFFHKCGVQHCYHVFEGANPNVHKPVEADTRFRSDISFITNIATPEKNEYLNALKSAAYNTRFYGPSYENLGIADPTGKLTKDEWAKIHSSSKYMLSMGTFNNVPTYFSGRLFETLACGVCTFQVDNTGTLRKYFNDGEEVILFKDKNDLLSKMHFLSEEDRVKIAINGREKVLRNYTWHHTVSNILRIAEV